MRRYRRSLWMGGAIFLLTIVACVTINIYFPAEKVESVAGEIVDEIRGKKAADKESLFRKGNGRGQGEALMAFICPRAWAEEPLTVSNPTIRSLKDRMKARYAQMRPFYEKGVLKEGNNGYVSVVNADGLGLKEKRDLNALVSAENSDRGQLYSEVARALKIDPAQVGRVAEIQAREWQKPVR